MCALAELVARSRITHQGMNDTVGLLWPNLNEIQHEFGSRNMGATCLNSAEFWDLPSVVDHCSAGFSLAGKSRATGHHVRG